MKETKEIQLNLNNHQLTQFLGPNDQHILYIEKTFNLEILSRGQVLIVTGESNNLIHAEKLINNIIVSLEKGEDITLGRIKQLENKEDIQFEAKPITYTVTGKHIYPKTKGQHDLINAMIEHDMVFSLGPAGTGKTFLAVAYGVKLLRENKIKRIILVRPAVEAGENLGFLPGDLKEKVDPYLQPLYDALNLLLGQESVLKYMEKGIIEIAPLAYMRGRTLDDAMVILDEAQNTTKSQMKMFLTRMGFNSKMIINGDITQIDLKNPHDSGLLQAIHLLKDIEEISIHELNFSDIVRHALVSKILKKYQGV